MSKAEIGFPVLLFRFNEAPTDSMFTELFCLLRFAKMKGKVHAVMNLFDHSNIGSTIVDQLEMQAARLMQYGGGVAIVTNNKLMRHQIDFHQPRNLPIFTTEDEAIDQFRRSKH